MIKVSGNISQLNLRGNISQLNLRGIITHGGAINWDAYWALQAKAELESLDVITIRGKDALNESIIPDISAFSIIDKIITNIVFSDNAIILTISVPFVIGDSANIIYVYPSINKLRTLAGNLIASFNLPIIINTSDLLEILSDTTLINSDIY